MIKPQFKLGLRIEARKMKAILSLPGADGGPRLSTTLQLLHRAETLSPDDSAVKKQNLVALLV
jgi:hypothetical protein